ncbi:unnamed protein product [Nesidiocoris tenuis]|uniref:Uncharacterized protein n=1 Tax=Nesidiocoris tenuis TaxID=355587 RepID=A0A6H5H102_9HEMI|nr:unnamed protein product [Nesidiocoris tenuis]
MLGFQTSEDYENAPPSELPTRRPFLLYRGSSTTPHQIQKIPPRRRVSTTPAYEFGARRSLSEFDGVGTNEQQHSRPPVRVLVTKRPLGSILVDPAQEDVDRNSNLISRRQLESRDNQDVYSSGRGSARPIPSSGRESRITTTSNAIILEGSVVVQSLLQYHLKQHLHLRLPDQFQGSASVNLLCLSMPILHSRARYPQEASTDGHLLSRVDTMLRSDLLLPILTSIPTSSIQTARMLQGRQQQHPPRLLIKTLKLQKRLTLSK